MPIALTSAVETTTAPSITGVPTISGTEQVGKVLTASAASVTGSPTPTRTWQWKRNGTPITGSTSSTHTLVAADEGATLTVVQTETNSAGSDTAESAATGTIAAASPSEITLSLSANRTSGTAPAGVQIEATATSPASRVDMPYHDIEYVWSFDDVGNYQYLDNSPMWGTSKNVAYGPVVSHVFVDPGTYTVSCTAYDGENTPVTETITITVNDPDTVFSGTQTAVVSTASNFAGAPSGAGQYTSVAAAMTALGSETNQRIMLRYGETYNTSQIEFDETTGSGRKFMVDAFGTPADGNPFLDEPTSVYAIAFNVSDSCADECMVRNIDYEGGYDPTSATPVVSGNGLVTYTSTNKPYTAFKTTWGCHIKNSAATSIDVNTADSANPMINVYVGDCWLDGWMSFGLIFGDGGESGFCGVKAKQPTGTRNGPNKGLYDGYEWPDHCFFRCSRPQGPCTFHNCDIAGFNDWSSAGNSSAPTKYSMNPGIRWNSGAGAFPSDQMLNIDRLRSEGFPFEIINETSNTIRRNNYALVDRFYAVLTSHQRMANGHGGSTLRNGVFVAPNARSCSSVGLQGGIMIGDTGYAWASGITDANARRIEIYSCAFADLQSDDNSKRRDQTGSARPFAFPTTSVTDSFIGNNIGYAPNRVSVSGYSTDNPLNTTGSIWTPLFDGERWLGTALDTDFATPAADICSYEPLTGSAAIGGASGKVSLLDFDGNLRSTVLAGLTRSTPSKGPYEPNLES